MYGDQLAKIRVLNHWFANEFSYVIETYVSRIADERMIVDDEVVCLDDEEVAVGTLRHQVVGEQLTQRNVDAHRPHHSRPVKHRQR